MTGPPPGNRRRPFRLKMPPVFYLNVYDREADMRRGWKAGIFAAGLAIPGIAAAGPALLPGEAGQTAEEARAMADRAVAYFEAHGRAAGLAEVNRGPIEFDDRDLYVFVYDLNGTCRAHARRPGQTGINLRRISDGDGNRFIEDWIRIARSPEGQGWSRYSYAHEASGRVLPKMAWIRRYDDLLIGVSAFIYPEP